METLSALYGIHRGDIIVVAAPGPSLTDDAVWDRLPFGATTIACSWAIRHRPMYGWDYWLCIDHDVLTSCGMRPSVGIATAKRCLDKVTVDALVAFDIGVCDDRQAIQPGMVSREWCDTGTFPGQRIGRGKRTGGNRLYSPGSSLVCAVHFAAILLGGEGEIILVGADGRNVDGKRRFCDEDVHEKADRQLRDANACLERSREAMRVGLPKLRMWNATPGSAIKWPQWSER